MVSSKTLLNLLLIIVLAAAGVFEEFEELLLSGAGKMSSFRDDFLFGEDQPKEIEINCPGPQAPIVTIRDIIEEQVEGEEGPQKCMILRLTGANFNMKLEMNCNDEDDLFTHD